MVTSFRPMLPRERAELEGMVSPGTAVMRGIFFLAAIAGVGVLLRLLLTLPEMAWGVSIPRPLWLLPTALIALWLYRRSGRWTGGREFRDTIRRDLQGGVMARHRVVVAAALEAPEVEDEGPVVFVREEEGDILFFAGQELARQKMRGFPWREFEIIEAPESRLFCRLKPLSEAFPDVQTRSPLGYEERVELGIDGYYGRVDATLDALRREV